jgi:SNF2 family DNA or RNA helicase
VNIVSAVLESAGVVAVTTTGERMPRVTHPELSSVFRPELRQYQQDGVLWLCHQLAASGSAMLADEMGLGKTLQAITTADIAAPEGLKLVLAPAIAVPHWKKQIAMWAKIDPDLGPHEWQVMSYDTFRKRWEGLQAANVVILDECHYLANPRAKRAEAVVNYIDSCRTRPLVLQLTGTPIPARVRNLWQVLDIGWPGRFGSKWQFEKRYCDGHNEEIKAIGKSVWVAEGSSHAAELRTRLSSVMLRRLKADVAAELPTCSRVLLDVEPEKIKRGYATAAKRRLKGSNTAAADFSCLLGDAEASKITAAVELAQEAIASGKRPLLLTLRKESAERIANSLMCPVAHGDTPATERRDVLLAGGGAAVSTIYAVTTGIDLTEFDTLIFVGLDWVPATLLQAEARLHRIGALRPITIYYLVALGTVDEHVRERVLSRLDTFASIIQDDTSQLTAALRGGSDDELLAAMVAAVLA